MYQIDLAAYKGGLRKEDDVVGPEANRINLGAEYLLYLCFAGGEEVGVIYAVISRTAPPISDICFIIDIKNCLKATMAI